MRSRRTSSSLFNIFYALVLVYVASWVLCVSVFEFQLASTKNNDTGTGAKDTYDAAKVKGQYQYPNHDCKFKYYKDGSRHGGNLRLGDGKDSTYSTFWKWQSEESSRPNNKTSTYLTMYGDHRAKDCLLLLPGWLQQYIEWNRNLLPISIIHKAATPNAKYLVMTCLPRDSKCGGLSDRLRILPFYLLAAKMTSRLICIYWKRPFPLEEYLQPTKYGIQWICPADFGSLIDESKSSARQGRRGQRRKNTSKIDFHPWHRCHNTSLVKCTEEGIQKIKASNAKYMIIDMDSHSYHHVNEMNLIFQRHSYYYSNHKKMPNLQQWSYPKQMGDIFRVLFKPVPILAQKINETMEKLDLLENEYVSVHVRSRYPVEKVALVKERIDAIDKKGQLIFDCRHGDLVDDHIILSCACIPHHEKYSNDTDNNASTLETTKYLIDVVTNAIECGGKLLHRSNKSNRIFFSSDHYNVTKFVLSSQFLAPSSPLPAATTITSPSSRLLLNHQDTQYYVQPVVGIVRNQMPLHFDFGNNNNFQSRDFDPVFEDLLIMGGGSCVSYGIGSYGSFGAALAGQTCKAIHRRFDGGIIQCPSNGSEIEHLAINSDELLFQGSQ